MKIIVICYSSVLIPNGTYRTFQNESDAEFVIVHKK